MIIGFVKEALYTHGVFFGTGNRETIFLLRLLHQSLCIFPPWAGFVLFKRNQYLIYSFYILNAEEMNLKASLTQMLNNNLAAKIGRNSNIFSAETLIKILIYFGVTQ